MPDKDSKPVADVSGPSLLPFNVAPLVLCGKYLGVTDGNSDRAGPPEYQAGVDTAAELHRFMLTVRVVVHLAGNLVATPAGADCVLDLDEEDFVAEVAS